MELRHLEIFCRIYEYRSFSKAADALYLSQPTLSGHSKNLEESLGKKLFDRLGREIVPTRAGELLYGYARNIVRLKEEAREALHQLDSAVGGRLEIGGSSIPGDYLLPSLISRFKERYPEVTVNLHVSDTHQIVQQVAERKIEVGVVGARTNNASIESTEFIHDELVLVAPASSEGDEISEDQFRRIPLILRERGSGTRACLEEALNQRGIAAGELNVVSEIGSTEAVKRAVKSGLGCTVISRMAVSDDLARGEVKLIALEGLFPLPRNLYVVTHRLRDKSPICQTFIDYLLGSISTHTA